MLFAAGFIFVLFLQFVHKTMFSWEGKKTILAHENPKSDSKQINQYVFNDITVNSIVKWTGMDHMEHWDTGYM